MGDLPKINLSPFFSIREAAKWLSWLRQGINRIKADIDKELGMEELQSQFRTDSIASSFINNKAKLEALDQHAESDNIQFLNSLVTTEEKSPALGK